MKQSVKRLSLPVVLVFAMLLLLPFLAQPVQADPGDHADHTTHTAWSSTGGTVDAGTYYLADHFDGVSADIVISGDATLCLNGKTLDLGSNGIYVKTGATLSVCDCASGGQILSADNVVCTDTYKYSGCNGNFDLYSGTLSGGANGILHKGSGTVTVYGGRVEGEQNGIYATVGALTVEDGIVKGTDECAISFVSSRELTVSGGRIESENYIAVSFSNGTFNMSGDPIIAGGTDSLGNQHDDIGFTDGCKITVTGPLTYSPSHKISVHVDASSYPYTFTAGWHTYMATADRNDYFERSSRYVDKYNLHQSDEGELQFDDHRHSWQYNVSGNVLSAICTDADGLACSLSADGYAAGEVTLHIPADLVYNAAAKTATVSNTLQTGAGVSAISYEKDTGTWTPCATVTAVGDYRAVLTVTDNAVTETVYAPFTVSFLETAAAVTPSGTKKVLGGEDWYTGDITLTAPAGFTVAATLDGTYATTLAVTADCNGPYTYYLYETGTGYYAEKAITLRRDTTAPTLKDIQVGVPEDTSCTLTVIGEDVTGIATYELHYWKTAEGNGNAVILDNTTGVFSLADLAANTSYTYKAVLTDRIGNIYTDTEQTFKTAKTSLTGAQVAVGGTYTFDGTAILPSPSSVTVTLNGHTVPADQYTIAAVDNVSAGMATLTVTATATGDYAGTANGIFTIAPCSITVASALLAENSFPYAGISQTPNLTVHANGADLVGGLDYTVTYYRGGAVTSDTTTAGEITVKITGTGDYTGEKTVGIYTITRRGITVTAEEQFLEAGEQIRVGLPYVSVATLLGSDTLSSVNLHQNGHAIQPSAAVIRNGEGQDVSGSYQIVYLDGECHTLAWDAVTHAYDCTYAGCAANEGLTDSTAPTGSLTVTGTTYQVASDAFHASFAFSHFEKGSLSLSITGADALSGLGEIAYYVADRVLSAGELPGLIGWTHYTAGPVTIPAQNGKSVAVYARLTDKAGNVAYLSVDKGVTFDLVAPEIGGIVSGATYYVTRQVTLSDLLSGIDVRDIVACPWDAAAIYGDRTAVLTLPGDRNVTYSFRLYDLAGHAAVKGAAPGGAYCTVTVKPIATLSESIDHLDLHNVTVSDIPTLQATRSAVAAVDTTYATPAEKSALQAITDKCDSLLAKVQNVTTMLADLQNRLAGYDINTVTSADRTDLVLIDRDLDALRGEMLTTNQTTQLTQLQAKADALLTRVDDTAAEIRRIQTEASPFTPATVTGNDAAALDALIDGIDALLGGRNLTAPERADLTDLRADLLAMLQAVKDTADEIARITATLDGYTVPHVKSSDKTVIEAVMLDIASLQRSAGLTPQESATLQALEQHGNALLTRLRDVAAEINRLSAALGTYQIRTVTTNDIPAIRALYADTLELLSGDNLTEPEREAVTALRLTAEWLLERVEMIATEIARITAAINGYKKENVSLADKADIEQLITDIDTLLGYTNLLNKERDDLDALRTKANDLLKAIAQNAANNTEDLLDALRDYDIETVKSKDKDPIDRLRKEMNALLDTDLPSAQERKSLADGVKFAEELLAEIKKNSDELARLLSAVASYDINTVTSDDRADIEAIMKAIDALAGTKHLTEEERADLANARLTAQRLLDRIAEAYTAANTAKITATAAITTENFKLTDKATLEAAKADIEKALATYGGNYTASEKEKLQDRLATIETILFSYRRIEAIQAAIDSIPDNVSMKDPQIAEDVGLIENAYSQLTDHEKDFVDRSKIDALLGTDIGPDGYAIIKGKDSFWMKGSDYSLAFRANGDVSKLRHIRINGVILAKEYYVLGSGETSVSISPAYLDTLPLGPHTFTVQYTDGEVSCSFTIQPGAGGAGGQDNGNPYLWLIILIIILCVAGGVTAVIIVLKNERKPNRMP